MSKRFVVRFVVLFCLFAIFSEAGVGNVVGEETIGNRPLRKMEFEKADVLQLNAENLVGEKMGFKKTEVLKLKKADVLQLKLDPIKEKPIPFPFPPMVEMKGLLKSAYIVLDNDTDATKPPYRGSLYDKEKKLIARLISKVIPLPRYNNKLVHIAGYKLPITQPVDNTVVMPMVPLIDVRKIQIIDPPPPPMVEMKGLLKSAYIVPDSNTDATKPPYRGSLYDKEKKLIARLISKIIPLPRYNNKWVHIAGYKLPIIQSVDDTAVMPMVPLIDVRRIQIIDPPPPPMVEMKGLLKAAYIVPDSDTGIARLPYRGLLYDKENKLIARLTSKVIPLPRYNNKWVHIAGYKLPIIQPVDDTAVMPMVPLIDVRRIKIIDPPPPPMIEMKGLLKAILTPEPMSGIRLPYRANLFGQNGRLIARLVSKTVRLPRYDGLYVLVAGYELDGKGSDNIVSVGLKPVIYPIPLVPTIDVRKIKIIHDPPPVETWVGIAYLRITDSSDAPNAPIVFKDKNGVIGFLNSEDEDILAMIRRHAVHYLLAVTGPVKEIANSTSNKKLKVMNVEKVKVLQDLRHVIWMSHKPIVVKVGQKVDFNKIGGFVKPIYCASDCEFDNGVSVNCLSIIVRQKYWDFDLRVSPRIVPVDPELIDPDNDVIIIENDGIVLDNDGVIDGIIRWVPVVFVEYDYTHDSRNKCMDLPVHVYRRPGLYRVTLTGAYADRLGFVKKMESASRIIKVVPRDIFPIDDLILEAVIDVEP